MERLKATQAEHDPEFNRFFLNSAEYPSITALWTAYVVAYKHLHEEYGHGVQEPPMSLNQFMPTKPIAQLEDVERRLKVGALRARILENTSTAC